jgi:hypothetical protein
MMIPAVTKPTNLWYRKVKASGPKVIMTPEVNPRANRNVEKARTKC